MELLQAILPIVIYFLLIIMLVIGIILGIKFIKTMNKVEKVVDDVSEKVESLNGFFHIMDFATDKLVAITDTVVDKISMLISRLFFGKSESEPEPKKKVKKEER